MNADGIGYYQLGSVSVCVPFLNLDERPDMLTETQLERYADVLLWALKTARSGRMKKRELVLVQYHRPALRLAEILYAKLLQSGRHPVQRMLPTPVMEKDFYKYSDLPHLSYIPPGESELYRNLNGSIFLYAPESLTHLQKMDARKIAKVALTRKALRKIIDEREETGVFSWTLGLFPTAELAAHAQLNLEDYARQVVHACLLNRRQPVAHWQQIYKTIAAIKKGLNRLRIESLHIESGHVDLRVKPGPQRKWLGLSGHNIPSFEIFTSPDWRGTRGVYFADQPSYRNGNYVRNVRLEFKKGLVVDVRAEQGEDFIKKQLAMDRGACRLGEFSLTDKRFSRVNAFMANTLYDENYGGKNGNCHVALGSSYTEAYAGKARDLDTGLKRKLGFNDSALHWDLVNTEPKRVTATLSGGGAKVIYENGIFQI
jgi:aminopeptidase